MNTQTQSSNETRVNVLNTLRTFINSRPGLEYANYGDASAYRSDYRRILRDRDDALMLLRYVEWHSIDADKIIEQAHHRLTIKIEGERVTLDYCAGQYYPVEYRDAACSLLSSVLWAYFRDECKADTGDKIRKTARNELGARIARRWFH